MRASHPVPPVTFTAPPGFLTLKLAHLLNSLVRVSRRVDGSHDRQHSGRCQAASKCTPEEQPQQAATAIQKHRTHARQPLKDLLTFSRQPNDLSPPSNTRAIRLREMISLIPLSYLVLTHHSHKVHQEVLTSSQLRIGKNPPLEPFKKQTLLTELQEQQSMGAIPSFLAVSSSFNSLFRVLCTFRSRYLFAIDISAIFSLGWHLPPILGLHSQANRLSEIVTRIATQQSGP